VTTCQLFMRHFKDGATITVEPWRSAAFPIIKDLVVDRTAFDKILQAGGFISVRTGSAQDANNILIPHDRAEDSMDAAACVGCGATYHVEFNPPKQADVCDTCGQKLILRDDDKPETVKNRLNVYHEQTQPLIDYYQNAGVLKQVDGTKDMNDVFTDIVDILSK